MRARSRFEQKFAVLEACMVPLKSTHIMYRANLNQLVVNEIISVLVERELLTEKAVGRRSVYRTSAAGYELVKQWRVLDAAVGA